MSADVNHQIVANPDRTQRVVPDVEPINEMHLTELGLVVVDIAAMDRLRLPAGPGRSVGYRYRRPRHT
jgi:hypothetical protein